MNVPDPAVSIILPTYNRRQTILRAIDSVLNQTFCDFELHIVDDGSTDNTGALVAEYKDKRIHYTYLPVNSGAGVARNRGLELSKAKYIAFQDSDDEWLPNKLERQMAILTGAPESVGMVYTDMLHKLLDGSTENWYAPDVQIGKIANLSGKEYQVRRIGQQTTLIRKKCFDAIGAFDTTLPRLIDLDFFIRLMLKFNAIHLKEPLVVFHESCEGISSNKEAGIEARLCLLQKYSHFFDSYFRSAQYAFISDRCIEISNYSKAFYFIRKSFYSCPLSAISLKALIRLFIGMLSLKGKLNLQ